MVIRHNQVTTVAICIYVWWYDVAVMYIAP